MVLPRVNPHFKPLSPCLKRRSTDGDDNSVKDRKSVRWSGSLEEIHYIPPREKKSSRKSREQHRNDRDMVDELLSELTTAPIASPEDVSLELSDCTDTCSMDSEQWETNSGSSVDDREVQELEEFEDFELELERLSLNATPEKSNCGLTKQLDKMEANALKILRDCEMQEMELANMDFAAEQHEQNNNSNTANLPSKAEIARLKVLEKILFDTSLRRNKTSSKDSDSESVDSQNSCSDNL